MRWILLPLLCIPLLAAHDWPQFLGPHRNGSYLGKISPAWPAEGPTRLWSKDVGQGFSGPVVSDGKLILFHRRGDEEQLLCLDAATGKELWTHSYPTKYEDDFGFDEGPRATPAIAEGRVYSMGAEGMITCVDLATGRKIWSLPAKTEFKAAKGFFGMACSPLVEGSAVLLNIGGSNGAGIIALDAQTGKLKWKSTNDEASYSSPVAATIGGIRYAIFFTRSGLVILQPAGGKVIHEFPWRARMQASVNAATPLVVDNSILLSTSYDTGAILLQVTQSGLRKIWAGDDILSNHYATSVYHQDHLYGFDGRQESGASFVCVEFKTGKTKWRQNGFGSGTVTLAGDRLLILKENGELVLAPASPEKFKMIAEAQILGTTRAYPAIANGRLYARDKARLVCVDLGQSAEK